MRQKYYQGSIRAKRAFTIVELIIVIAVIGVLAAILIPTFTNIINKSHIKSDVSNLRNINTMLASYNVDNGRIDGGEVLYEIAEEAGYSEEVFTPTATGHTICFDANTQQMVYVEIATGKIVFPGNIEAFDELSQPLINRESMCANANFHPVYTLNDNLQFTGNLEITNASGINLRGYVLHCESLTINTVDNAEFKIVNGSIEVEGELIVNGHHITHSNNAMISCASATINVANTTYELGGTLNVTGQLNLSGETRLLKHEGAALQYGTVSTTGSATMVNEDNSAITASDVVDYTVNGTSYATLELAYAAAGVGDTIHVSAGFGTLSAATLLMPKSVDIQGAGKFLTSLSVPTTTFKQIHVKSTNMTFSDMSFVGKVIFLLASPYKSATNVGFSSSNITFENLHFDRIGTTADNGAIMASCQGTSTAVPICNNTTNLKIKHCSFLRTTNKAMYFESVNGLLIEDCWFRTMVTNPETHSEDRVIKNSQTAIDINLKGNSEGMLYDEITISKCNFEGYATQNIWGAAIALKERGTGMDSATYSNYYTARVKKITVADCKFADCQRDVVFGEYPGGSMNETFARKISVVNCRSNNPEGVRITDYTITSGGIQIYSCTLLANMTIKNAPETTRYLVVPAGETVDLAGYTLTLDTGVKLVVEAGGTVTNGTIVGVVEGEGVWPGK